MMNRRIVIHPGFHKTGTSSIQHFLWVNRAALGDRLAILQLRHLKEPARMCMSFSRRQNPLLLSDLVDEFDAVLAGQGIGPDDPRDILVSCEALSGHCPGWPGVIDYSAAPFTATVLAGYFAERFEGAEVMLVYTTREPQDWLRSAWRHHLVGQKMTEDVEDWSRRMQPAADLQAVVQEVAGAIAPAQVFSLPLADSVLHEKGPGGALLELLDLPSDLRAALEPVGHANRGPDEALSRELLWLNRSNLGDHKLRKHKARLLEEAGVVGWVKPA